MFNTFTECEQIKNVLQHKHLEAVKMMMMMMMTSDSNRLNTKCLGDFGDGVGDKLCCGQTE